MLRRCVFHFCVFFCCAAACSASAAQDQDDGLRYEFKIIDGRLIRCDTPRKLRDDLDHSYFAIHSEDPRKTREALEGRDGVLSVLPAGEDLRLILDERAASAEELTAITPFRWQRIMPSLEDVFIALVRHEEVAHAA